MSFQADRLRGVAHLIRDFTVGCRARYGGLLTFLSGLGTQAFGPSLEFGCFRTSRTGRAVTKLASHALACFSPCPNGASLLLIGSQHRLLALSFMNSWLLHGCSSHA